MTHPGELPGLAEEKRAPAGAFVMQRAFVVQLKSETNVSKGRFAGRVEHVDSGEAVSFRNLDEFLAFVAACLDEREAAQRDQA